MMLRKRRKRQVILHKFIGPVEFLLVVFRRWVLSIAEEIKVLAYG